MSDVLVVGDEAVARRLAERLRHHGYAGAVTVLAAGPDTPLALDRERRRVTAPAPGAPAAAHYDTLVLTPEARPLIPGIPGLRTPRGRLAPGVTALSSPPDPADFGTGSVVVLGAGALAVESACALAARGGATTLVCAAPHPMHAQLGDVGGAMLREHLEAAGITVVAQARAARRQPGRLHLDDGTTLPADTLLLCTGTTPDTRLARAAGLDVGQGITVDEHLRTSDPRIRAIGAGTETAGRVTSGPSAIWDQAETLAGLLTGHAVSYRPGPPALRLRTGLVDVSVLGAFTEPGSCTEASLPGTRLVGLTDRAGRRYARIALRDERVVAAVLLGLPRAIATVGLLYRRGRRLPSDRLGLLLDLPPRPAARSAEGHRNPVVCLCNDVSEDTLFQAWRTGLRSVATLAASTRATTSCGLCSRSVEELCDVWAREPRAGRERAS